MRKHEKNKILLDKFTLDQLHELCKEYKREMHHLDYRDRVVLGETDKTIIKKRFIPYIVGFFDESDILQYAKKRQIKID
ncbi:MAG: hypothetical protein KGI25_06855 [Thaumarchaeota archaeon]|nr:hypothetical protein [Nitrososphaerota archaeon]